MTILVKLKNQKITFAYLIKKKSLKKYMKLILISNKAAPENSYNTKK